MQEWKFKISGKVNVPGMEDQTLNLYPENFRSFNRISDYLEKNEPMILTHLVVDKNLFDIIVKNAKTETIYIKIEKYDKNSDLSTPNLITYIEDEFSVILSHDINYNKELDYMETNDDGTPKEDVYRDVSIGLMSKKAIDANKVVANTIIYDSSMFDIVCSYMSDLHLLIEPFDHNPIKEQLPIPPQETLTQTIEFLNSIDVFYNTQYLLFIDEPYCTYLLSRSGKGVQKVDEKYIDVYFDILKSTDDNVVVQGMEEDDDKKQYRILVPAVSTKYTIDHDAAKMFDRVDAIVNPSINNGTESNIDIQSKTAQIEKMIGTFRDYVYKFSHKNANAIESISMHKMKFHANLEDFLKPTQVNISNIAKEAISGQLGSIPSSVSFGVGKINVDFPLIPSGFADGIFGNMTGCFGEIGESLNKVQDMDSRFSNISDKMIPEYYKADYLDNHLGSVTAINAQDVIQSTNRMISSLKSGSSSLKQLNDNGLTNQLRHVTKVVDKVNSGVQQLEKVSKTIDKIEKAKYYSEFCGNYPGIQNTMNCVKDNINKMNKLSNKMVQYCDRATNLVNSFTEIVNSISTFGSNVTGFINSLRSVSQLNLKSNYCNIVPMLEQYGQRAQSAMQAFKNIGETINKGSLSYSNLKEIQKNLNSISDIRNIGNFGISDFKADLQIGGCFGNGKLGTKIIKSRNDNPNEIKNIKSEIETMINQLSISKEGLDPSVFTPNKRYTINNYDAHGDKNGIFILNKKTEVYTREDESFSCTTILDFAKIVENNTNSDDTDTQIVNNNTSSTDWYKQKSGETVFSNKTVNADSNGNGTLITKDSPRGIDLSRNDTTSILNLPNIIMH